MLYLFFHPFQVRKLWPIYFSEEFYEDYIFRSVKVSGSNIIMKMGDSIHWSICGDALTGGLFICLTFNGKLIAVYNGLDSFI